jgi:hypothetical protein
VIDPVQTFQHRVEELAGFFGIAIGQQLHGAFEIGKEHGDLLAFALESAAGGEDFLGEVGWSVRLGRWGGHRGCSGEGCGALPTEGEPGRVVKATLRAAMAERAGTLPAKLHLGGFSNPQIEQRIGPLHDDDHAPETSVVCVIDGA